MTTIRHAATAAATDTAAARTALLALHQALLADARATHEREHGRTSNAAFLQLAAHDPRFAWLGVLSALIVRLDLSATEPAGKAEHVLDDAAVLLRCAGGGEFAANYVTAIQASPEVAVAAARARTELGVAAG
jgi:hypothetical protein